MGKLLIQNGGPGRDRTDDLFHAMELGNRPFVDGKGLMSRRSRQNRFNRRIFLKICYQNSIGHCGLDCGGSAHFS
jgi:hypothetical protein